MVQMVHPEGVSHKGTKPDGVDRSTEVNAPIKPCGMECPTAAAAILIELRVADIALMANSVLGYQKDVMDVELMADYIDSQTRSLQLARRRLSQRLQICGDSSQFAS
jgi:hypothetical protein